jgi:hypothetical protein
MGRMMKPPPSDPQLQQAVQLSVAGLYADAILIVSQPAAREHRQALALMAEMKWRGGYGSAQDRRGIPKVRRSPPI